MRWTKTLIAAQLTRASTMAKKASIERKWKRNRTLTDESFIQGSRTSWSWTWLVQFGSVLFVVGRCKERTREKKYYMWKWDKKRKKKNEEKVKRQTRITSNWTGRFWVELNRSRWTEPGLYLVYDLPRA